AEPQRDVAHELVVVALEAPVPVRLGEEAGGTRRLPRAEVLLVVERVRGEARRGLGRRDREHEALGVEDRGLRRRVHDAATPCPRRGGACPRAAAPRATPRSTAWSA